MGLLCPAYEEIRALHSISNPFYPDVRAVANKLAGIVVVCLTYKLCQGMCEARISEN